MNRQELKSLLDAERVDPESYSIWGESRDETYCLEAVPGGWAVFYAERGLRSNERWFSTDDEACAYFAHLLLEDPTTRRV